MAMLIGKFHRMIQSRLLWAGFLVVVVFSFVIWGMVVPRTSREARRRMEVGKIDGRPVSYQRFREAYLKVYLSLILSLNRQPEIDARLDRELRQQAWKRLVQLEWARRLGLSASDEEVIATIRRDPHFLVDGRFSEAHYQALLRMLADAVGISERGFEEYVREEILLQKMRMMVTQAALVTPFEQQRAFRLLTDVFDLQYVVLSNSLVRDKVRLTEDEVRAYYEKDPEAFAIPPRVKVKYVAFPLSNYLARVTVTEEELRDYYDQHADEFIVETTNSLTSGTDTNTAAAEAADATGTASTNRVVRPFDEVRDEIARRLRRRKALDAALDEATGFVVMLAPDRQGNQPEFDAAARSNGLEVISPPPFSRDEVPAGVSAGLEFTRAAFSLTKAPDEYFSDAVAGTDAVYVIALEEKMERRIPGYEEVRDKVRQRAEAEARRQALVNLAENLRSEAEALLRRDPTNGFAEAAGRFHLPVETVTNVTAGSGITNCVDSDLILRAVLVRSQGELTEPVPADDHFILAYVRRRTPASAELFSSYKKPIINALRRERGRMLLESWENYLMESVKVSSSLRGSAGAAENASSGSSDGR